MNNQKDWTSLIFNSKPCNGTGILVENFDINSLPKTIEEFKLHDLANKKIKDISNDELEILYPYLKFLV